MLALFQDREMGVGDSEVGEDVRATNAGVGHVSGDGLQGGPAKVGEHGIPHSIPNKVSNELEAFRQYHRINKEEKSGTSK